MAGMPSSNIGEHGSNKGIIILKTFADRLCIYHGEKLIAAHTRSYDRHQDFEDPEHGKELLDQRRAARAMESAPVSRASLQTKCGGMRLQCCPSTLSLDAVGLAFFMITFYGMPVKITFHRPDRFCRT